MIKLNFWRRLVVNFIYAIGLSVMLLLPSYLAVKEVLANIEFVEGNQLSLNWAVSGVLILIVFGLIYIKYLRKVFHRKLQSLSVRDELGIISTRGVLGIIIDRLLRTIEFVYPFVVTLVMLYIAKYAFGQYEVFGNLYDMNIFLLYMASAGFGFMLIGDFIKVYFMGCQEVDDKLDLKAKTNKLELKQLKKANKNAMRALAIERQLALLKETENDTEDELEPIE